HGTASFSDAGKNNLIRLHNLFWVVTQYGFEPQTLYGKFYTLNVSSPVINNNYVHFYDFDYVLLFYKTPFVLGRTIFSASRFTAILIAFAKALKMASILWCSLVPSALMLRLALAPSVND